MDLEQEDRIISAFLISIGPWRKHVVIGGGYALFIYKLYLANQRLDNPPVGTRDIDSLIPRRVPKISKVNIAKHLQEAGFEHVFRNIDQPASEAYVKDIDGVEIEVEFLTDSSTRTNKNENIVIAGVVAQPLSYLALSLVRTREFQTFSSETGRVVSPGAWMFHKGLTFTKRKTSLKMLKDLYGIWYVSTQLGIISDEAITEFKELTKQRSAWFKTLKKNLNNWIEDASPDDWSKLEMQDPSGNLKTLRFKKTIKWLLVS